MTTAMTKRCVIDAEADHFISQTLNVHLLTGKMMPEKICRKSRVIYARALQAKYKRKQLKSSHTLKLPSASHAPPQPPPTTMSAQTSFQAVPRILVMNVHSEEQRVKTEPESDDDVDVKQEPVDGPLDTEQSFIIKPEPVDGGYEEDGPVGDTEPGWVDTNVVHIQPTDESMEVDLDVTGAAVKHEVVSSDHGAKSSSKSTAVAGRPWCSDWTVDYVDYDDSNANSVRCSSVDINDSKLKMRPVVVLEDIVEKILSASYTAPPVGTAPVGTDEQNGLMWLANRGAISVAQFCAIGIFQNYA